MRIIWCVSGMYLSYCRIFYLLLNIVDICNDHRRIFDLLLLNVLILNLYLKIHLFIFVKFC